MTVGPTETSPRLLSWDLLRVGFVGMVLLHHATFVAPLAHPELEPRPVAFGHQIGASMLLLISAYFACAAIRRGSTLRFWWGRVARLLPAFVAVVLLDYLVLRYLSPAQWFTPVLGDLGANLLMLWHWDPVRYPALDPAYWTLPLQLLAFTTAALLWPSQWGHGRALRVLLWAAVLVPLAQWPLRISDPPDAYRMIVDGLGLHRAHLFVAGIAIWLWARDRLGHVHFVALLAACVLAQTVHTSIVTPDGLRFFVGSVIGVTLGMIAVAVAARGPDWRPLVAPMAVPAITWLAGISYGVYLTHQTIGFVLMRWLHDWGFGPGQQTIAMIMMAVLLGWLLTAAVERPVHGLAMRVYDRSRSTPN